MESQRLVKGDALSWLLAHENPGVRYLALRDLARLPEDSPELRAARRIAHTDGPISEVLMQMEPDGYWVQPGKGYAPKYRGSVWSLILLAQLGASMSEDARIGKACAYILDHALMPGGLFTATQGPAGNIDCLQGNLCWALTRMGCEDPRLEQAFDWMARAQTGEGVAPAKEKNTPVRYHYYKCGPDFACAANGKKPCAWGAAKVMLAFSSLTPEKRTPLIDRAIARGVDFLLGTDPAEAMYPTYDDRKPSGDWWKFGFPVYYVTDLLQVAEALIALGYGDDPRLKNALELICRKQDAEGRWLMEYPYGAKTWSNFGRKGLPNPWVTIRALRVISP